MPKDKRRQDDAPDWNEDPRRFQPDPDRMEDDGEGMESSRFSFRSTLGLGNDEEAEERQRRRRTQFDGDHSRSHQQQRAQEEQEAESREQEDPRVVIREQAAQRVPVEESAGEKPQQRPQEPQKTAPEPTGEEKEEKEPKVQDSARITEPPARDDDPPPAEKKKKEKKERKERPHVPIHEVPIHEVPLSGSEPGDAGEAPKQKEREEKPSRREEKPARRAKAPAAPPPEPRGEAPANPASSVEQGPRGIKIYSQESTVFDFSDGPKAGSGNRTGTAAALEEETDTAVLTEDEEERKRLSREERKRRREEAKRLKKERKEEQKRLEEEKKAAKKRRGKKGEDEDAPIEDEDRKTGPAIAAGAAAGGTRSESSSVERITYTSSPDGNGDEEYEEIIEEEEEQEPEVEMDELRKKAVGLDRAKKQGERNGWGYGFVVATLFTMFGSITIAVYYVVLNSDVSIPNIMVNVSVFSLLFFLLVLFTRYFALIFLSFLHHTRSRDVDEFQPDFEIPRASVLVPAYNEGVVIEKSIASLLELNYPNYEIIVIDDGSADDTLELAKKWEGMHDDVEVVVLTQKNKGKAAALNHGASVATGEVVVCMDGDSKLSMDTLSAAMRHFINPEIGAVAGNVKVINRNNMLTRLQSLEYLEGLNLVRRAQAYINAVNIVPGPIGLFRRKALLEVGGWDSDTFAEDCDLSLKILTSGWKVEYEPDAISLTEAPEKLLQLLKQRYRWTRGILQSMRKHSSYLIRFDQGWRVVITMWQMVMEAVLWPLMNIMANIVFIVVALLFGISPLLVLWWVQLTVLDTIAALHSVAIERESLSLVPYGIIYRLVFIQIVDVTKMIATIEELLGVKMGWGKLERKGRL